jgi:ATP-binding cassette subfamily B protein
VFRFLADPDIRRSLWAHRTRLVFGSLALLGRAFLALAGPFYIGRAVDVVQARLPEEALYRTVGLMALFGLMTAFCQFWMRWIWIGWSRDAELLTRDELFARIIRFPVSFFDRSRTGELLSRFTSDVEAVRMGYGPGIMHLAATGSMTLAALVLMIGQSPLLTACAAAPLLVLFFIIRVLLPRIHERSQRVQEQQAALSARAQESFSGARVVKAFARETHEEESFRELSQRFLEDSLALARSRAFFSCLIEAFGGLAIVAVLVAGGWMVIDQIITLGAFVSFSGYLNLLVWPMIAIGWTLSLFQRAEASEERLEALRKAAEPSPAYSSGPAPSLEPPELEFRNLTFTYPGAAAPALLDVNVRVPAGSTLGVVGPTAAGKTTLTSLLCRVYEPPPGTVFLAGRDVLDFPLEALRRFVAVVPQEGFLFSDTIGANVAFGKGSATREQITDAVSAAGLEEDVAAFPAGLDTLVGERGITLSGGQRQRTAIARALLTGAPVLVLDDALSAVDTETESRILDRLAPHLGRRTSIIISHRLSAVAAADHILVLENGRLVEEGDHAALLRAEGPYARLWSLQQTEEELERL